MRRQHASSSGFSLIEIMIVIVMLAIIAMIAVPSYQWAMRKTRRAEGKALLQTIMAAEEQYYSNKNRYTGESGAGGINVATESLPGRYYVLSRLSLSDDAQAVVVTVDPQHAQQGDSCGSLTLDSVGRRGATGSGANPADCW